MSKVLIPLKFKQIALDNFEAIPKSSAIRPLIAVAGKDQAVADEMVIDAIAWLDSHGCALVLKPNVTVGKGVKRLRHCLVNAINLSRKIELQTQLNRLGRK